MVTVDVHVSFSAEQAGNDRRQFNLFFFPLCGSKLLRTLSYAHPGSFMLDPKNLIQSISRKPDLFLFSTYFNLAISEYKLFNGGMLNNQFHLSV